MAFPGSEVDIYSLRSAIIEEYQAVAKDPHQGFHFHTGRTLIRLVGYEVEWLQGILESSIEDFASTGNPFSLGAILTGENVVDVGGVVDQLNRRRSAGSRASSLCRNRRLRWL